MNLVKRNFLCFDLSMNIVIGVDAGGTGTRAVALSESGAVVARGLAGPGNPASIGSAAAASALADAVGQVVRANDTVLRLGVGVAGISGVDEAVYRDRLGGDWPIRFYPDVVPAFAAGTTASTGTVLIAGTGAVAATIHDHAIDRVADGLGWLVGDEGSGVWLGLSAVRFAARAWGSPLAAVVAGHAGACTVDDLVNWANRGPRDAFAALAPQICRLAANDADASELVSQAADRLVSTLDSLPPIDGPLVIAGGLLGSDTAVQRAVVKRLSDRGQVPEIGADPALGAALLAIASPK
jgi:glucosamine kinase